VPTFKTLALQFRTAKIEKSFD